MRRGEPLTGVGNAVSWMLGVLLLPEPIPTVECPGPGPPRVVVVVVKDSIEWKDFQLFFLQRLQLEALEALDPSEVFVTCFTLVEKRIKGKRCSDESIRVY
jgi:hypothetical protein